MDKELIPVEIWPEAICPKCEGQMRLVYPREEQEFRPFWACKTWTCLGVLLIDDNGKPYRKDAHESANSL